MTELHTELRAWCESYVTAFSAYDSDGISRHWAFPALIISGHHNLTFESVDAFTKNTDALLGFYRKTGVTKAERYLTNVLEMGEGMAAITVTDQMLDARGAQIVNWQASYVLRQKGDTWLAVMANADGEVAAWKARGTPLGR